MIADISFSASGRVAHLHCRESEPALADFLARTFALSRERSEELIGLGAIYRNHDRAGFDTALTPGDYLRVHLAPRRYPLPESIPVIEANDDFVLVDKPPGLPVPPTVDNLRENMLAKMEAQLGKKLYVTHRLDTPTSGLLVLARTPAFQTKFNRWLHQRRIEKWYRAEVAWPLSLGPIVHYQKPSRYAPHEVSSEPREGWLHCALTVLECRPIAERYQVTLRLETGRTHQIRCQLAALGNPVLGDTLYDGTGGAPERIALQARALFLPQRGQGWRLR